ncbi:MULTISPECIES: NAD-dependent epimerase/dehydratase family protein [unclassified Campylobacter]|uniref:NAD-dependent epimerase/dehydratase family protein n=1 Tax=unclassified Campylobacter TaxID=2593542 RepID=UPI003D346E64
MKKVVIFGGSGFLGGYVADELTRRDYSVIVADKFCSDYIKDRYKFVEADILDEKSVEMAVLGADIVYNFAAVAELEEAIANPIKTININVLGNSHILQACRNSKTVQRFVYASSAYALSIDGSFYGISKYASEKITAEYYRRYGLKYTIIRYGSLYGERASYNNYIYNLLTKALRTGRLEYKGDGQDLREYIHAADAARLSVDILQDIQYENEHVILTGIEKLKRLELLTMINEMLQNRLEICQISDSNFGHYKITPYSFHPTTAKKLVANPYIDIGQGLLECIQEIYQKQQEKQDD